MAAVPAGGRLRMGTIGGLVVPLVLAAAIGFAAGWFFARAGGTSRRSPEAMEAVPDHEAVQRQLAQRDADYARRVEVFSKREAELLAAGRKVVEQLRAQEEELDQLRVVVPDLPAVANPDAPVASVPAGVPETPVIPEPPVTVEPPVPTGSSRTSEAPAGSEAPTAAKRNRRRSVIDPATGLPIQADAPAVVEHLPPSSRPGTQLDEPADRGETRAAAELSVRLIAPDSTRTEPRVVDLRWRGQAAPSSAIEVDVPSTGGALTDVIGIGPKTAEQLSEAGIVTLGDLAGLDPDGTLPASIKGLSGRLRRDDWVGQAKRLIG